MQTVRDVQRPLIAALLKYSAQVGARVYLADTVMSSRPTLWFCGSPMQRSEVFSLLNADDIRVFGLRGRARVTLDLHTPTAQHAVAYQKHVKDGVVVHGAASGIEIAFCAHEPESNIWKACRAGIESEASEDYLRNLDEVDFLGFRVAELRGAAAMRKQREPHRKVDLVYTWVDGDDPAWQARRRTVEEELGRFSSTRDATQSSRFNSQQELLFAVRSAFRYFVDIGSVYIVTDQQYPSFLGDLLGKVTIVDHRDIFPSSEFLPSFNSHAIEANLHRIPQLREYYLYLNDDVMFSSAMSSADFFDEYGRIIQFFSNAASLPFDVKGEDLAVNMAGINNRNILIEKLGIYAYRKFRHVALPTRKSIMETMEYEFPAAWSSTLPNRFRSPKDFSIAGALFQQYSAAIGKAIPGSIRYEYLNTADPKSSEDWGKLLSDDWSRPQMFCINDTVDTDESHITKQKILNIVERVLPEGEGIIEKIENPKPKFKRRFGFFGPRSKGLGLNH